MSMNAIQVCGIVTNDYDKALEKIEVLTKDRADLKHKCLSRNDLFFIFENGDRYRWVKPIDNSRCVRLHKMWIDRDVSIGLYEFVVRQMCSLYCEEEEYF